MPLHRLLRQLLTADYVALLEEADRTGDFEALQQRMDRAAEHDPDMQPWVAVEERGKRKRGTMYRKAFAQAVRPKIIHGLREALRENKCPELHVTLEEARRTLGENVKFGSPQDFTYTFTSERGGEWSHTLRTMGFQSAYLVAKQEMAVCAAPRFLAESEPDMTVEELDGAIATDTWESLATVFTTARIRDQLDAVLASIPEGQPQLQLDNPNGETASSIITFLQEALEAHRLTAINQWRARDLISKFREAAILITARGRRDRTIKYLAEIEEETESDKKNSKQEQVGLKYADEGKFLQKLLGGLRVDHLQSNVKMIRNPLRGSSCEIDSVYRVITQQRIVLLESKAGSKVSRAQLYQAYETFRSRLPHGWAVDVVAVLMSKEIPEELALKKVTTIIDLVSVGFDDEVFGDITPSLASVRPTRRYRWYIKRAAMIAAVDFVDAEMETEAAEGNAEAGNPQED